MLARLLFAALCAAPARAICREPHPLLPTYWSADEPKLAVVGIYFKDLPASHVPTPAEFAAMVHGPAVVAALDRMSDGCLNATTFAPDFYVVKNEGATHPLEEGGRVSCGQADDFFETSSVRNLGFDFDDYDGVLFSPVGHCSADGSSAGWYKYVGRVDGGTVYNVQGIFMSTDLRPWCALSDAACDFAAAAPYGRDRTYVHELVHWFGFAAHSSMFDCADPDADGLDPLLCAKIGYGDPFSVMGPSGGVASNLPAYIKYHLGWLGADDVEVVQTRGEFQLAAVDAPRGGAVKRFAYLPESDLYVHWRSATELPDPAGPEPEDEYAGFFVHRWATLVDAHVTSCAAGDDEAARAERAARVTLKPGSTFKVRTQGVVLRAGAAGGATRGLEVHFTGEPPLCLRDLPRMSAYTNCDCGADYKCGNTANYCGEGGEAFRPFRSNFDGSDRVPDFPGGVTLHSVSVKNADLEGCGDRAAPFDLAVARTELPEGYGFDPQKYHMELQPREFSFNARSMAFAFGLPANMSDGDYDSCVTATNHDTGLRAAQIHRITLPYDGREVWYRNNRPADYAGVDPDLAAYCASLNGCGRADGDCPAAGAGGGHCDLDKACDGADAPFGPEGRCFGDGASRRGRDQCGLDQSFCVGGAPLLDAPSACDDPLPPPCLDQTRCFQNETIWNKLVHHGPNGKGKDGNCGGMRNLCPQPGAWASGDSISLSGEPFCETDHLMACSENGSHYSQGIINARHECWQNGGDADDMACVRALCEATPECGGYTITTHEYEDSLGLSKALWFQTASIAEPGGANWRYECWRKPKLEAPCYCNAPGEQTQPAGACASPGADATTTTTTAALSAAPTAAPSEAPTPAPTAAPSEAPTPAPSPAPTGDTTTTTTTTTAAPSPAPSPAPTGGAVDNSCKDDADWLAKSNKKKKRKCEKQTKKKKCKKKCAWVEGACVEKLQTCEDLFYKKGKPKKEGAKLAKTCKKKGTIGAAKKKASAACQKACGACDEAGAVVGATTTTADFSSIEDGGGAAEDYAHCWERGYCVEADGSYYGDRNSAYGPADPDSGVVQLASGAAWHDESHEKALECMSLCNANPDFKGCEIVFGKHNRGCYGHARAVARGHVTCDRPPCGAASGWQAKCWVKDWGCAAEAPTKPPSGPSPRPTPHPTPPSYFKDPYRWCSAPTPAPGACDAASWRDKSLVCGECTVLVKRHHYETCDRYCAALGGVCVSARMADRYDTCELQTPDPGMACDTAIGREDCGGLMARCDALCECTGIGDYPVEYTPPTPRPTPTPPPRCDSWCPDHSAEWTERCGWDQCAGCSRCTSTLAPSVSLAPTPSPSTPAPSVSLAPTVAPTGDVCDEASWPDVDHGLVCGDCKVLVNYFSTRYKTCDGYCAAVGRTCTGAWEEASESCGVLFDMTCDQTYGSSDAICECGGDGPSHAPSVSDDPLAPTGPPPTPPPTPRPTPTPPRCDSWCPDHSEEWLEKCRWNNCAGCDPCMVVGCDEFCDDRPEQWTEKCDWPMCAACGPCAGDAGEFGQGDGDFVASGDEYGLDCSTKKGRDSKSWHRKAAPTKTCKWVKRKPLKRCRKKGATGARALTECVRACASCPSEGACADDATWSHTNKKNKKLDCVSVARNPGRRCGLSGAADACRATCGTCP